MTMYAITDIRKQQKFLTKMIEESVRRQVKTKEDREYWHEMVQQETFKSISENLFRLEQLEK